MNIEVIIRIHELISLQSTGIPCRLAEKLGLSERSVYNYLGYMKKTMKAPIKYNPQKQTYYYYEEVKFCFVGGEWRRTIKFMFKMKNNFLLLLMVVTLSSCKSYIQVYETNSNLSENQENFYIYENDTLKITYSFWMEKGVMAFTIYNKLDKPIYIDWKKSSYIDNSVKLNYWEEEERNKTVSSHRGYCMLP